MPLVIAGATSGSTTIQATDAVTATITLPSATGTVQLSGAAGSFTDLTTTGNTILGDASTDTLNVGNGGLIKDASGNVGVGVTPSAWASTYKAIQIKGSSANYITSNSGVFGFTNNAYVNSANDSIYLTTGSAASRNYQLNGAFNWATAPSGTAGNTITWTDAMTLDASGGLKTLNTIGVGNATPSASGAGITFPATQSASTDANTLDDYEEGTWTPTITATTGAYTTVAAQSGSYTKIGRQVTLRWYFTVNNKGTGSGAVNISNLPFASNVSVDNYYAGCGYDTSVGIAQVCAMTTTTSIDVYKYDGTDPIIGLRGQVGKLTYFV